MFGSERYGLSNDDVYRCHACLSDPDRPRYGSLNLAQAVQLIAYDWRQALGGFDVQPRTPAVDWPTLPRCEAAWCALAGGAAGDRLSRPGSAEEADAAPAPARSTAPQLRREEVHILRGMPRRQTPCR